MMNDTIDPESTGAAPEGGEAAIVLPGPLDDSVVDATEHDTAEAPRVAETPDAPEVPFAERRPLIAGNWKMNLDHLQAIAHVQKISWALKDAKHDFSAVEVAVFPPFTDLRSVQTLLSADRLPMVLGAQDVSPESSGAFTGDIAAAFLAKLETRYVLVGHSERRQGHAEDDARVAAKAKAAALAGLVPVICVGETAADLAAHGAAAVPVAQLRAVLAELPEQAEFVVAYEPVWAIGSGEPATPAQAEAVAQALRAQIAIARDVETAQAVRVLYGGSVTSQNVAALMREPDIDGALVGGASLDSEEFTRIARFRSHVTA